VVGWDSYRDQWITEGLANYIALVGADAEKPGDHLLAHWLDYYRKDLTSHVAGRKHGGGCGSVGARSPLKFVARPGRLLEIIYGKGAWVFHMLRVMLQAPASKNPDERFIGCCTA